MNVFHSLLIVTIFVVVVWLLCLGHFCSIEKFPMMYTIMMVILLLLYLLIAIDVDPPYLMSLCAAVEIDLVFQDKIVMDPPGMYFSMGYLLWLLGSYYSEW